VAWTRIVNDAYNEATPNLISLANALRFHPDEVSVNVSEQIGPRLEKNTVIETSALPLSSFVRFDEGSGYTQYAGYWTTILSEYHISKPLYDHFEREPIPPVGEATIAVLGDAHEERPLGRRFYERPIPRPTNIPAEFDDDLERRLNVAGEELHRPQSSPDTTTSSRPEERGA
jgi:hypothetical protein